jgi:pimeloyl-ACP methyl ester carboxylesterase
VPTSFKALALKLLGALLFLSAIAMWMSRAPDWPVESLVARWAPPPSQFIELDGQLVHLRDVGPRDDPEPLLLLHGAASSLHTWEGWVKALGGRRRIITVDLPGFGLSGPSPDGLYGGDREARFVLALMDHLQVPRFAIGGNSLGGEAAWRTALLAPQRVTRLILIDATGLEPGRDVVSVGGLLARAPLLPRLLEVLLPRPLVVAVLRQAYGDPARIDATLVDRYYEMMLRDGNRQAFVQRFRQREAGRDAERLRELKLPTLILWGGRDRLLPPGNAKQFQGAIAGSQRVVFNELGHMPQEEDAQRSAEPVSRFLPPR